MEAGEEGADEEVVDIRRTGLAAQLRAQVARELLEVLTVGADGVGRGVALAVEVAEEGRDLLPHARSGARERGQGRGSLLEPAQPRLEALQAGEGALGEGEALAPLVPDARGQFGQ